MSVALTKEKLNELELTVRWHQPFAYDPEIGVITNTSGHQIAALLPGRGVSRDETAALILALPALIATAQESVALRAERAAVEGAGHAAIKDWGLRLHLGSRHALANWRDCTDPEGAHRHEHTGPCTIRNHDSADLTFDYRRALDVETEMRGQDRTDAETDEAMDRIDAALGTLADLVYEHGKYGYQEAASREAKEAAALVRAVVGRLTARLAERDADIVRLKALMARAPQAETREEEEESAWCP